MLEKFINRAEQDLPVYINSLESFFISLDQDETQELSIVLEDLDRTDIFFTVKIPYLNDLMKSEIRLIQEFLFARVYNILSSLGGRSLTFMVSDLEKDKNLKQILYSFPVVFGQGDSRKNRQGYGRSLNVIERMVNVQDPDWSGFEFCIKNGTPIKPIRIENELRETFNSPLAKFKTIAYCPPNKRICGIDIGGTDIKLCVAEGERIVCFKEYDWFPAKFRETQQLIDPVVNLLRLLRGYLTFHKWKDMRLENQYADVEGILEKAMDRHADMEIITEAVSRLEVVFGDQLINFDAIGMCFPDVVIRNKIVGGEVYKTRGIRNNPAIDYETNFKELTHLDIRLQQFCNNSGTVKICNDGPMAAFTAAVELAASPRAFEVSRGNFAHTLGTELGTGWVNEEGDIPDIPLEVYNFIIDLGSNQQKNFEADDVRSILNFNNNLSGTLQKYTSQSGVFRLAVKFFSESRPDLLEQLYKNKFIERKGAAIYPVVFPKDNRKDFLEYMMALPEKDDDPICQQIWIEVGQALAVTWLETDKLLNPAVKKRILFGRLVKNKRCFELLMKGARQFIPSIDMEIADSSLAYTPLMRELDKHPDYTVAQFAQAVGAIYFANL